MCTTRISCGSRTITFGKAADPIMLDPLFGFQFIQTTTRSPEQMPRDRDMRRGKNRNQKLRLPTGAPAAAPGGRWALGTGSAQRSAKCQGLHPGRAHTAIIPGAAGLLRQRATLEKSPGKERSIPWSRNLPGSTRSTAGSERCCSSEPSPPGLFPVLAFFTERKIYLLLSRFGILFSLSTG